MDSPMSIASRVDSVSATISRRAVQLLAEYTGRGSTHAHTVVNHDSVMVLLGDILTKGERKLVEDGAEEHVLETRRRYQRAMRDDLVAVVEEATGRKVAAFLSDNHLNPDLAVEIFVLEPVGGDGNAMVESTDEGPAVEGSTVAGFPVDETGPVDADERSE
jgi:uncharacterized protein YbcI